MRSARAVLWHKGDHLLVARSAADAQPFDVMTTWTPGTSLFAWGTLDRTGGTSSLPGTFDEGTAFSATFVRFLAEGIWPWRRSRASFDPRMTSLTDPFFSFRNIRFSPSLATPRGTDVIHRHGFFQQRLLDGLAFWRRGGLDDFIFYTNAHHVSGIFGEWTAEEDQEVPDWNAHYLGHTTQTHFPG